MKKLPLVTIVTISYNQAEFLERTILSVINQSYKNIEYIIFDGGSTDGSIELIEKYKNHFTHIHIGPDGGAANALNSAFKLATGDLHAYINSDDELNLNTVKTWVNAFEKYPDSDIIYGDIDIIDENGKPTTLPKRKVSTFLAGPYNARIGYCGVSAIPQQASCTKAYIFKKLGGFEPTNRSCWDGEFFVDAIIKGAKFKRISGILAKFRVHGESISGTNKHEEFRRKDHKRIKEKWDNSSIKVSKFECILRKYFIKFYRALRYVSFRK